MLPGLGNDGPTGGSPHEAEPGLADNDLAGEDIDLDETEEKPSKWIVGHVVKRDGMPAEHEI